MTTCTFAGHREVYQPMMDAKIEKAIRELLQTDSEFIFYTGGMGEFDSKCVSAVRLAKRKYPHLEICLALVLPYMSNRLNTEKAYYEYCYDEIIIPEELCGTHYKPGPFLHITSEKLTHNLIDYSLHVGYNIDG